VFSLDCVNTSRLQDVQSAAVYKELMATPPNPRIERAMPGLPWTVIRPRLAGPGLSALAVNTHFSALHDLLGVRANQHPWRQAQSPDCPHCADHPPAPPEAILSHFTACRRTSAVWAFLLLKVRWPWVGPSQTRTCYFWPGRHQWPAWTPRWCWPSPLTPGGCGRQRTCLMSSSQLTSGLEWPWSWPMDWWFPFSEK
jgi:hypothetical protein